MSPVLGSAAAAVSRPSANRPAGQLLALPEGDLGAPALVKFAQLDGMHRLIGGKPNAIDMRERTPEETAALKED